MTIRDPERAAVLAAKLEKARWSRIPVMDRTTLHDALIRLGLNFDDCAFLLSVTKRAVRRWVDGSTDVPGPVDTAIRGWLAMKAAGIDWRPLK